MKTVQTSEWCDDKLDAIADILGIRFEEDTEYRGGERFTIVRAVIEKNEN